MQSGRADAVIQVAMLSLVTVKKNPNVGKIVIPGRSYDSPPALACAPKIAHVSAPSWINWLEYNRSSGVVTDWITSSLALVGVQKQDIPADLQF